MDCLQFTSYSLISLVITASGKFKNLQIIQVYSDRGICLLSNIRVLASLPTKYWHDGYLIFAADMIVCTTTFGSHKNAEEISSFLDAICVTNSGFPSKRQKFRC